MDKLKIGKEVWKDIIGYENSYQISNKGNLRSLDRLLRSGYDSFRNCKGVILKTKLDKYGYLTIGLSKNQCSKWYTIHRLVAIHFIPNPENKPTVNHIDGNKLNNNDWNLEWNTVLENFRHAKSIGLRDGVTKLGEDSNFSKLKEQDVLYIRKNYNKKTMNMITLSKKFKVCDSLISQILSKKIWRHLL